MRSTTSYDSDVDARVAAASAAAIAYALELKPKIDIQPPTIIHQPQKIKKLVRRNASDKLKLIQMVHDNPILWDSRLPNFKGAEEEKNHAWELIGKEFNAPGRRVARAFKSLRESYRRELAHVKLMGNGFKPKWSLYEAMDFLRDVIRERKGGSHATADHNVTPLGLNLSAFAQHLNGTFHNSNNNSNSSNSNNNNNSSNNSNKFNYKVPVNTAFTEAALNLTKCAPTSLNEMNGGGGSGNDSGNGNGSSNGVNRPDYYYNFVKTELDLSQQQQRLLQHQQLNGHNSKTADLNIKQTSPTVNNNHNSSSNNNNNSSNNNNNNVNNIPPAHQNFHNDSRVTSTHNDATIATTTTTTIPNAPYMDDVDDASMHSDDRDVDEATSSLHHLASTSHHESDEVEELEAIDADFPYPLILNSSNSSIINGGGRDGSGAGSHDQSQQRHHLNHNITKRKRKYLKSEDDDVNIRNGNGNADDMDDDGGDGNDDDEDDIVVGYGGNQQQQYHQQHQQQHFHRHLRVQNSYGMGSNAQALMAAAGLDMLPPPQTIREVLNTKFCGFISAKLNSMEDSEADNLMNKILMLLVQTQTQTSSQTPTQPQMNTPAVEMPTSLTAAYGSIASTCTSASTSTTTAKKCNSNDTK